MDVVIEEYILRCKANSSWPLRPYKGHLVKASVKFYYSTEWFMIMDYNKSSSNLKWMLFCEIIECIEFLNTSVNLLEIAIRPLWQKVHLREESKWLWAISYKLKRCYEASLINLRIQYFYPRSTDIFRDYPTVRWPSRRFPTTFVISGTVVFGCVSSK